MLILKLKANFQLNRERMAECILQGEMKVNSKVAEMLEP